MSFFEQINKIFNEDGKRSPGGGNRSSGSGNGSSLRFSRGSGKSDGRPRRLGVLVITILVLALLIGAFVLFSGFYTDMLWYQQLGFFNVFTNTILWRVGAFAVGVFFMFVLSSLALRCAYHFRPVYAYDANSGDNLDNLTVYRNRLEQFRKIIFWIVPLVPAVFIGFLLSAQWEKIALFIHREPFGIKDPEFGRDISFYTNVLPFLSMVVTLLLVIFIICALIIIFVNYLYCGIRIQPRSVSIAKATRLQLGISIAIVFIIFGVRLWLERYSTLQSQSGKWAGALYTDVNAAIPVKSIMAIASLIVAVFFIVAAVLSSWRLPLIGTAVFIVFGLLGTTAYPWVVQQFQVQPSELSLQKEYIKRNIDITRQAYGLDEIQTANYEAKLQPQAGALRKDQQTIDNIRLLDPNIVSSAFKQIEGYRPYYGFPSSLRVDRYEINGQMQDAVVAVRDLDVNRIPNQSWVNQRTVYTHGYGFVAAAGDKVTSDGKPLFIESGIPVRGELAKNQEYEPRIYFSEASPEYSIVGAPEGTPAQELDHPNDKDGEAESYTTFKGDGGPKIGNFFNKIMYAMKYQSTDLLLSDRVNPESQILYDRDPRTRVQKAAPYLTVDSNVYPAVIDGRVKWILDAYTTSASYPYSTAQRLDSATKDSLTVRGSSEALKGKVNYIRNSVKATVDAYDGKVTLYAWDDQDPILKAWRKVYPSTVKPLTEMSGDLMSHVRYPEDLFKVQRELLTRYHVTEANDFYSNNDAWSVPNDPTVSTDSSGQVVQQPNPDRVGVQNPQGRAPDVSQPPYYLSLSQPGEKEAHFSLTSTFIPQQNGSNARNVLYGFLSANSNAGKRPGVKGEDYGKLTLLELPRSQTIPGPGRAQNDFNSNPAVSQELNLLRQGESEVINGSLLTLPVGSGFLYVQPVYVQARQGDSKNPSLQRVLVSYGEKIGFAPTLDAALNQLFAGNSGVKADQSNSENNNYEKKPGGSASTQSATVRRALDDANKAMKDGQEALARGDWSSYGKAQEQLKQAIKRAMEAEQTAGESSPPKQGK